ncbi:MAG TPA: DNA replication protein [Ruminococcaceae bacterium]|nr:DNA replication protein [Oscillospiraceae bacterium]
MKRQRRILARCGLSEAFRRKTLENYEERNEHAAAMKGMACDYAANTTGGALKSIGFFGQSGIGKTHLSIALANILMQKGIAVLYMPYVEKIKELKDLNRLQSRHDVEDACYDKAIAPLKTVRVLMIDDLFKRSEDRYNQANPADVRIMFEILNDRYLKGLPVIVSSELTLTEIIRIDEAFGGRLIEMCGEYCYEAEKDQRLNYRLKDVLGG